MEHKHVPEHVKQNCPNPGNVHFLPRQRDAVRIAASMQQAMEISCYLNRKRTG